MLGALVFATHPVQVESVAWASGTKDLLFGFFGLAAVLAYLRSIDAGRVCRGWFAAATLLFALGLLSKPTSVVVPAVAGVCAWLTCTDRATLRRALAPLLIWIALAIPAVVVAKLVQPADHGEARTSLVQRPLVAIDALAFYARQLAWPAGLAPDYARPPSKVLALPAAEKLWWLLPVALAAAGLWDLRRNRWPAGAGLVFVLGVAPVLGLVPFDFQKYSTVADHYLYLSMLGVAMLVAWAAVAWPRPAVPVAVLVAFALAGLSFLQAQVWRDTGTLFEHTLAHRPDSLAAPVSLSAWSMERNRPDDAMRWAQLAVERHPRDAQGHVALAVALAAHSRLDDAVAAYRRAIELSPTEAPAYANLAGLLAQTGKVADALPLAQRAIELDPSNPAARVNLGTMLLQSDRPHEALPHLELAVQLAPGDVTAHTNYGFALLVTGRPDLAAGQFRRALEINPAHRPAVEGYRAATGRQ
jgi:Flp pilus assembly protein TadD